MLPQYLKCVSKQKVLVHNYKCMNIVDDLNSNAAFYLNIPLSKRVLCSDSAVADHSTLNME